MLRKPRPRRVAAGLVLGLAGIAVTALGASRMVLSDQISLSGRPGAPGFGFSQRIDHFNVGQPHSPQLMKQFSAASGTLASSSTLNNAVQGIDVSSFQEQNPINWADVAGTTGGKQFAAIKVTEGDYYRNKYALPDLEAAKTAGLATVAYVFAIPNGDGGSASPITQADDAINFLKSGPAGVPPIMLDIEYDPYYQSDGTNQCYGLTQSAMGSWVTSFAAEVQSKTGRPAIIYTTQGWWNQCVGTTVSLAANPLWIAAYTGTNSPGTLPDGWSSGGQWTYWQYSASGTVSGITGSVDLDQLNPNLLTALNPGDEQDTAGATITPVQLHASQPVTYSSTTLPAGLSLSSSGLITGTAPASAGSVPVTITATNNTTAAQQSVTFTWYSTGSLTVNSPGDQTTVGGSPVSFTVTATDSPAQPPITFSAPALPPGLSMTPGGRISGWADKPGTYQVTVYAADALESAGTATFTWTVTVAPNSGPAGPVRLDGGGTCLDDPNDTATNGTAIQIWSCDGSAAQHWTYAQDDTLRINGLCLQSPPTADYKVRIETCTGYPDQQWQMVYPPSVNPSAGGSAPSLYNPAYGMCLDDPNGSTANGNKQVVWPCDGNSHQQWTLPGGPVQSGIPGQCVDDYKNQTANGTKIDIAGCNGTTAQAWKVQTNGTIQIHGKCLDVHGSGTTSGTPVDLYSCTGTGAQRWRLIADGGGVMLQNPHSGLCLADPGGSTTAGTQLVIMGCTATNPARYWRAS
jgi:GH25 family lysozyme M1 (1,4-beta-N-acetylmuramidase)